MARIPMTSGFQIMPEGEFIFGIYDVTYDEDFGKVVVKMTTADGQQMTERFSLMGNDGNWNEKALNAFSYFAKTALNDFDREDVDPAELKGHYIKAEVVHNSQPNRNDPTKTVTFANLGDKESASGFDKPMNDKAKKLFAEFADSSTPAPAPAPKKEETPAPASSGLDLDSLLRD